MAMEELELTDPMPCVCGGSRRSIRPIQNGIQSLCMNKQRLNKNEKEQFTWKKY